MRRQNRSCDQCRRSKRACDTTSSASFAFDAANPSSHDSLAEAPSVACSYCIKTNKRCTYVWAKSHVPSAGARKPAIQGTSSSSDSTSTSNGHGSLPSKRRRTSSSATQRYESFTSDSASAASLSELPPQDVIDNDPFILGPSLPYVGDISRHMNSLPDFPVLFSLPTDNGLVCDGQDVFNPSNGSASALGMGHVFDPSACLPMRMQPTEADLQSALWNLDQPRNVDESEESQALVSVSPRYQRQNPPKRRLSISSLSAYTPEHAMFTASNNFLISDNLLHIYHDVLEHNLSCWLSEETCPYSVPKTMQRRIGGPETVADELGSTWSNRIFSRVVRLDKYAKATKMIRLTRSEDAKAGRALHLSIMAFASQWAQGSSRERQQYAHPQAYPADELAEEFDRNVQRALWEQARSALQDVAELESFRVVCAELIFGLSQRPWDSDELDELDELDEQFHSWGSRNSGANGESFKGSLMEELRAAMAKDGAPVHMERAARKMHALKFRWDAQLAGLHGGKNTPNLDGASSGAPKDQEEHYQTVALVYWLAVMFDTVSSSMNERPVVVADEDSQHRAATMEALQDANALTENYLVSQRWSTRLFIQDEVEGPTRRQHWPCSYEAAAEALIRSAPVKVLLYRHVSYLQNVLRKTIQGHAVEIIIGETMTLYRYWNKTHGAFFKDLVRDYASVPSRIQSWFFCISAHWHLAALMFADLIEFVDGKNLGLAAASRSRVQTDVAKRIRMASACEISELASVATQPSPNADWKASSSAASSSSLPPEPSFHFAVNKHTILTEPWTIIVIRAFSKAGEIHLSQAEALWRTGLTDLYHEGETCEESLRRCEQCIRGLWLLGKKSDMARRTAEILSAGYKNVAREVTVLI